MKHLKLPSAVVGVVGVQPGVGYASTWANGLLFFCEGPEFGPNCIVQNVFCQPCVVTSAMGWSRCSSPALTFVGLTCCAETPFLPFTAYSVRRHVIQRYQIVEDPVTSCLIACFCLPCSNTQVVNKVAREEGLSYQCARIGPANVVVVPVVMER
jgi:hypothetical protein